MDIPRTTYKIDVNSPKTEAAAALSTASIVFKKIDTNYFSKLLSQSKSVSIGTKFPSFKISIMIKQPPKGTTCILPLYHHVVAVAVDDAINNLQCTQNYRTIGI
ncbi:hypothetical protein RYX36_014003 [Vicia faba]